MKYRKQTEDRMVTIICTHHEHATPEFPDEFTDSWFEYERRISDILEDLTDNELIDMFHTYSDGCPFDEIEASIEWQMMQEKTTATITRADRMRLMDVNKNEPTWDNINRVLDLYERACMTPAMIDKLNPSESPDAEHVLKLALEVLHDRIPETDGWS